MHGCISYAQGITWGNILCGAFCTFLLVTTQKISIYYIHRITSVTGKGRRQRYVPIAKALMPYLEEYLKNIRVDLESDYVLATVKSGKLSSAYINKVLRKTTKKLGWSKNVSCHTLRRSFATNLLRNGVNVFTISKLLGHKSLKTTTHYLHLNDSELQSAVDTLAF